MERVLHESLSDMNESQIQFICDETGMEKSDLFRLDEDDLYNIVYDTMCDIEIAETPLDDSPLTQHCKTASSIVTIMGNAIAEANGYFEEETDDE